MMTVGTLVQYTPQENDPPVPAVIMRIWPDDKIELYLFHFDAGSHIRAAHPSQVQPVLPDLWSEDVIDIYRRLANLEEICEDLRKSYATPATSANVTTPATSAMPATPPTIPVPPVPPSPNLVEPTPKTPNPDDRDKTEVFVESVEPTRKARKSAWPT